MNKSNKKNLPVGVFDSGIGGLSILKEIQQLLPQESLIYLADNLYAPYGLLSEQKVRDRSCAIMDFLISKQIKTAVIACNTATAVAVDFLREKYNVPIVAIEPAIKPAVAISKTRKIGVLATRGTLQSKRFQKLIEQTRQDCQIYQQEGIGLVEKIERPDSNPLSIDEILSPLIEPLLQQGIDTLILGCTHYSLIRDNIQNLVGESVQLVEPGEAVARQLRQVLQQNGLLTCKGSIPDYAFYTSGKKIILKNMVASYLDLPEDRVNFY